MFICMSRTRQTEDDLPDGLVWGLLHINKATVYTLKTPLPFLKGTSPPKCQFLKNERPQ